jgi:hypothetical protein
VSVYRREYNIPPWSILQRANFLMKRFRFSRTKDDDEHFVLWN